MDSEKSRTGLGPGWPAGWILVALVILLAIQTLCILLAPPPTPFVSPTFPTAAPAALRAGASIVMATQLGPASDSPGWRWEVT